MRLWMRISGMWWRWCGRFGSRRDCDGGRCSVLIARQRRTARIGCATKAGRMASGGRTKVRHLQNRLGRTSETSGLGFCGAEGFAGAVGGVARAAEDAFDAADVVDGFAVGALAGLFFSIDFHFSNF